MIRVLTTFEASVYEAIKGGAKDSQTLHLCIDKSHQAIRNAVHRLESYGMVEISMIGRYRFYKSVRRKYEIEKKVEPTKQIAGDGEARGEINMTGYEFPLTEKQKKELIAYKSTKKEQRTEERTRFAKRIGIPKLYLNFYLQLKEA